MLNTSFFPSLRTALGTSLRPRQLNPEEERLIRYYRLLSEQDHEAVRCLFFAIKETSRAERPKQ
ncbi:hypothetical protein GIV23_06035 [Pseudomonas sp. PA-1-2A]|uniref:hypothetical protein n=1 Tax=Pseudomonas TaxID=286 RepID=UPI001EF0C554|nr:MULTISPECIES: hypothetical protein [Pseudomonas]MCF5692458.1 hypothetical protein [Pseudomonas sp. PA-1-8C]MCF5787617.1 hypothetical protein [Pseudomonas sp. PA-1-6G]MCF5795337.1 hypothetical protein [Pseudomonas sp. PA-1-6B]MCF5800569.1 hypothetical protein [Pseudomonas sp. PA-1-5A]MCF5812867.1 hypothetical protein [Pseudomonas sp. PA-1-2A]